MAELIVDMKCIEFLGLLLQTSSILNMIAVAGDKIRTYGRSRQ